jgi:uncharacterized surface protein with fasciclin (FAS1) repeats
MAADRPKTVAYGEADLVDTVIAAGKFSILSNAFRAAGLVETLKGAGPFTLFAPTDEAFRKLPPGTLDKLLKDRIKLTGILNYHLLPAKLMADDLQPGQIQTVQGAMLKVGTIDGAPTVDDARVTKANIETSNGVIHMIDAVVMPEH